MCCGYRGRLVGHSIKATKGPGAERNFVHARPISGEKMIALVGFKIRTKPDGNTLMPDPFSCPTEEDVRKWFDRARTAGFVFEVLPNDEARMSKPESADRIVWVETHAGVRVSLLKWI